MESNNRENNTDVVVLVSKLNPTSPFGGGTNPPPPPPLSPRTFRQNTYKALPESVQLGLVLQAVAQYSIDPNINYVMKLFKMVNGFSRGKYDEVLRVHGCKAGEYPFFRRTPDDPAAHFFYVYDILFTDLSIKFPFSNFYCKVLNHIYTALIQLHPNARAFTRCFKIACDAIGVVPSLTNFFYFYDVDCKFLLTFGWVSIKARSGRRRFIPFKSNAKNAFAKKFFKVTLHSSYPELFTYQDGTPRFPFYGT